MNLTDAATFPRLNRSVVRTASLLLACWTLSACFLSSEDCAAVGAAGLHVFVLDASTQRPIAGTPTVTITDGGYTETLSPGEFGPHGRGYRGALEREGRYNLRVEAPGYVTATRDALEVRRGGKCSDIQTTEVTVALVATPP